MSDRKWVRCKHDPTRMCEECFQFRLDQARLLGAGQMNEAFEDVIAQIAQAAEKYAQRRGPGLFRRLCSRLRKLKERG